MAEYIYVKKINLEDRIHSCILKKSKQNNPCASHGSAAGGRSKYRITWFRIARHIELDDVVFH